MRVIQKDETLTFLCYLITVPSRIDEYVPIILWILLADWKIFVYSFIAQIIP